MALGAAVVGGAFVGVLPAAAQDGAGAAEGAGGAAGHVSLWTLFWQSADLFTILLVGASVAAAAVIARCAIEIRERYIMPPESEKTIRTLTHKREWEELYRFVKEDEAFVSVVVRAALEAPPETDSSREAAELAASEQCAMWFRRIEALNILGTLGPLLGLAGTVWGMIIAFASLGETGGQAGPGDLSLGISKALFHTLLGLMLAVPALGALGFFRARVDRLCTRGMVVSAALVEMLIAAREKHG